MMKEIKTALLLLTFLPFILSAQSEKIDLGVMYLIKQEGLKNSKIEDLAFELTDLTGPRLTGSTGSARGNEWAKNKMEELGFQNIRIEEGRILKSGGWDNLKTYAAMTSPYYCSFACNPVAWTGSTNGVIKSEVVLLDVETEEDLEKYRGTLNGKIVLIPSETQYSVNFEPLASRLTDEQLMRLSMAPTPQAERQPPARDFISIMAQRALMIKISEFIKNEGVAAILNSAGVFNVPRSNGANYKAGDPEPIAEINLPVEAHGRMERLLKHKIGVEMEIEILNKFYESQKVYNVIGEIPGTDKLLKDELVLLGAHLDSWHGGTGAADNASGCIVMMEALRILKTLGISPRRTIRVALWGGEEQGYLGSRGYADRHLIDPDTKQQKPEYENFSVYFNMDNGTGKYRGIYLQENDLARPVFEEWFGPFTDMGAATVTIRNTTGTDHTTFDGLGLPGFQFIQDGIEYRRGYHTVMDTYERLVMADLKHNAVITAAFAYNAAMRDKKFPRKPVLKASQDASRQRIRVPAMN